MSSRTRSDEPPRSPATEFPARRRRQITLAKSNRDDVWWEANIGNGAHYFVLRTSWGWIVYFALSKQKKLDDREVGRADTLAEAQALAQRDYGQQTR
jgi:hypothetical protein